MVGNVGKERMLMMVRCYIFGFLRMKDEWTTLDLKAEYPVPGKKQHAMIHGGSAPLDLKSLEVDLDLQSNAAT